MRYLSVCSGIEAASVAWHALGMAVPVMRWIGERIAMCESVLATSRAEVV